MIFDRDQHERFVGSYPDHSVRLRHHLCTDERLKLDAIMNLVRALPGNSIEYNAGNLPVEQDPEKTPMTGLSAEDTIARIRDCKSWMVLKNVEQHEDYAALLNACIDELSPHIKKTTGPTVNREGFIFVSSPGSVTPFHIDPEHNILLQIAGEKSMHVFPNDDFDIVSPVQHEKFHGPDGHRNLKYADHFADKAIRQDLSPGDAVYVPVKAPHWVQNGNDVSISFSITWRSSHSDFEASLHRANAWLRAMGRTPRPPGHAPSRDRAAVWAHKIASRLSR